MPPPRPLARRHKRVTAIVTLAGLCCAVVAVLASRAAVAEYTRRPTTAQRAAAAAAAVARRWRSWPASRIFPATLSYTTSLLNDETAHRIGISPDSRCTAALDARLASRAHRDGCQAGIRASYVDQLQGVLFTTGVLAFPSPGQARKFADGLSAGRPPARALRALALPGTASALFSDAARQAATVRQHGPYVLLTVAGYTDGRPAAATGEYDKPVFTAAGQLAKDILVPLSRPAVVDCAAVRQWAC
jgi:hypothetical protein